MRDHTENHLDQPKADATHIGESMLKPLRDFARPLVSAQLPNGVLAEMVYDPIEAQTRFCLYENGRVKYQPEVEIKRRLFRPYSPENNLVQNEIVLFPSKAEDYGSVEMLVAEIAAFIHRYVDIDPLFKQVATNYILLTWVYDAFNELPYLRVRGDYGSGKTRFLLTVGSLCYKPIFASGASTVSPIFRLLDTFRGTLIIDEGDFRFSDERAELVKILNNGNARGFPVLRSEVSSTKEFNPTAYSVFGPKLVAMRGLFDDTALESRFITEDLGARSLREDVPINLPNEQREEARALRNKLLMYRFRNRQRTAIVEGLVQKAIEPRLNQVFLPLLSVADENAKRQIKELALKYQTQTIADRGQAVEGQVISIVHDFITSGEQRITVKAITDSFIDRHGDDYERKITTKWLGSIIRKRLNLKTQKSNGVYILVLPSAGELDLLYRRYGVV